MKSILLVISLLLLVTTNSAFAQNRIVVYKTSSNAGAMDYVSKAEKRVIDKVANQILQFYTGNERFVVIDRANLALIKEEQEIQKSEEFIDGYVVAQGKQEGADYIFYSQYDYKSKVMSIRVYDVASETVLCEKKEALGKKVPTTPVVRSFVNKLLGRVNDECFEFTIEVVRTLESKKGKARKILIAAGRNQDLRVKQEFEIYLNRVETVGGKELKRQEVIGVGEVVDVEDQNFSILKIVKGGAAVLQSLSASETVYCKLKY